MNPDINKLNSTIQALKLAEDERTKLKEKAEIIFREEKILKEQHDIIMAEFKKAEDEFNVVKTDHNNKVKSLKDEIAALKESTKEKKDENTLYFEIKKLKSEIARLTKNNDFLVTEIEDTKAGKTTPGFSKHI